MNANKFLFAAASAICVVSVAGLAYAQTASPEDGRPATKVPPQTQQSKTQAQMQRDAMPATQLSPESGRPATKIPLQTQTQTQTPGQMQTNSTSANSATPDSTVRPDLDRTRTDMQNNSTTNRTNSTNNSTNSGSYNQPNMGADGMNRVDRTGTSDMGNGNASTAAERRAARSQGTGNAVMTERAARADRN